MADFFLPDDGHRSAHLLASVFGVDDPVVSGDGEGMAIERAVPGRGIAYGMEDGLGIAVEYLTAGAGIFSRIGMNQGSFNPVAIRGKALGTTSGFSTVTRTDERVVHPSA